MLFSTFMQNENKHNISIVNFSWNMNVKEKEANKFCIFSCRERENDPEESFGGSRRNIIVIMPFSEYSTHSSPLFCVWKCSHESSSMLLDEAVTSTAPLCLFSFFNGCTQNLIHHYPSVIMEISVDLLGVL